MPLLLRYYAFGLHLGLRICWGTYILLLHAMVFQLAINEYCCCLHMLVFIFQGHCYLHYISLHAIACCHSYYYYHAASIRMVITIYISLPGPYLLYYYFSLLGAMPCWHCHAIIITSMHAITAILVIIMAHMSPHTLFSLLLVFIIIYRGNILLMLAPLLSSHTSRTHVNIRDIHIRDGVACCFHLPCYFCLLLHYFTTSCKSAPCLRHTHAGAATAALAVTITIIISQLLLITMAILLYYCCCWLLFYALLLCCHMLLLRDMFPCWFTIGYIYYYCIMPVVVAGIYHITLVITHCHIVVGAALPSFTTSHRRYYIR